MAHKKGEGSTQNGRDSISKRLGVKLFGGQIAMPGNIIVRQRGTKFHPGENVYMGKDFTLHAAVAGRVTFRTGYKNRKYVSVIPVGEVAETLAPLPKSPKKTVEAPIAPSAEKTAPKTTATPLAQTSKPEVSTLTQPIEAEPAPITEVDVPAAETPVVREEIIEMASSFDATLPTEEEIDETWDEEPAPAAKDNLKKIEGIGPKIEELLNNAGIYTFAALAATDPDRIREILSSAGPRYNIHDPGTWPKQAQLAAEGRWEELKALQDELKGGK